VLSGEKGTLFSGGETTGISKIPGARTPPKGARMFWGTVHSNDGKRYIEGRSALIAGLSRAWNNHLGSLGGCKSCTAWTPTEVTRIEIDGVTSKRAGRILRQFA